MTPGHLSRRKAAALLLSLLLVPLTTWILALIQSHLIIVRQGHYVRPFCIGYVVPIALITVLGGYQPGLFALALSACSAAVFLMAHPHASFANSPVDLTELAFLILVGALIVTGAEAARRNVDLLRQVREAAGRERATMERQRQFLRDVLASVTDNRLHLCDDPAQLPPCRSLVGAPVRLSEQDLRTLRQRVREIASAQGFADERGYDLMTAVSEAAMNAVVHAGGGEGRVCVEDHATVQVWVEDRGRGIGLDQLPAATLLRGHSTAGTLGHGFWLMLNTADRLWLLTGDAGTTVVLEQDRVASQPVWQ